MNFLDMRTVIFCHLVTNALCALAIASLWHQNRKRFAGLSFWTLDFAFQATAALLIVLRGSVPDWMSFVLANTLTIAGAIAFYIGLGHFVGKTRSQVHNYLLLAAFAGVHTYFTFVQPSLDARNLNVALGLLIVSSQSTWLLLRRIPPDLRRVMLRVGLVLGTFCLASLAWIVIKLARPQPGNDFLQAGVLDTLILLSYQMLLILEAYVLILTVNGRLLVEIKAQEEKFTKAFRSSPYAMLLTRLADGHILEVNDGFVDMSGYSRADAVGQTTADLRLWAREEERAVVVNELSKSQKVQETEIQFRTKSGAMLTGLYSAEIITLDNQPWVLSSINDITERKQAESQREAALEALIDSETRYRRLFEAAKDGILILDADTGLVTEVNPFLIELLGYSHAAFLGKKIWELGFFKDTAANKADFRELQQQDYIRYEDLPLKTADGRQIDVEFVSNAYQVNHHKVIQCNIRDITARKQAEEELRANRQQLTDIIEFLPDATLAIDRDKRVILWNKAIEDMTGVPAAEMIGHGDYAYTIPFYGEARPQLLDLVFADDEEIAARYPTITREGNTLMAEVFCNALYQGLAPARSGGQHHRRDREHP
jgi:PAS domain S-box-containing protein